MIKNAFLCIFWHLKWINRKVIIKCDTKLKREHADLFSGTSVAPYTDIFVQFPGHDATISDYQKETVFWCETPALWLFTFPWSNNKSPSKLQEASNPLLCKNIVTWEKLFSAGQNPNIRLFTFQQQYWSTNVAELCHWIEIGFKCCLGCCLQLLSTSSFYWRADKTTYIIHADCFICQLQFNRPVVQSTFILYLCKIVRDLYYTWVFQFSAFQRQIYSSTFI